MGKKLLEKAGIAQKATLSPKIPLPHGSWFRKFVTLELSAAVCRQFSGLSSSLWPLKISTPPQQLFTPSGKLGERPQRIFQVSFPQRCDALLLPGSLAFSWRESLNEGDMVGRHAATSSSLHSHSSPQAPSCFLSFPMLHALFSTVSLLSLNSISVYLLNPVKCLSYFQNRFARGLRMQLPGGALEQFSPQLCFLWSLFL